MKKIYIITGANGHLGRTIIELLLGTDNEIRGLVLPGDNKELFGNVRYTEGDMRDIESLRPLFLDSENAQLFVIHTASIVDISWELTAHIYDVNVEGTRNLLALCKEYQVKRLLYVSSVHAIPEKKFSGVLKEVSCFTAGEVYGGYAKSKAEASQAVLDAAAEGLNAVIVHPSGILGPGALTDSYLLQLVEDYMNGRLPACVSGGYDFVDVRDVAAGCLLAVDKGCAGECYILSNRHYTIREILDTIRTIHGGRRLPVLPAWVALAAAPVIQLYSRIKKRRPLYTKYSLYTLQSNGRFSHDKATVHLGYSPRDIRGTLKDSIIWIQKKNRPAHPSDS